MSTNSNPVKIYVRERPLLIKEAASPKKELTVKSINQALSNHQVKFIQFIIQFLNFPFKFLKLIVVDTKTFVFDHHFPAPTLPEDREAHFDEISERI